MSWQEWFSLGLPKKKERRIRPKVGLPPNFDTEAMTYILDYDGRGLPDMRASAAGRIFLERDISGLDRRDWRAEPGRYRVSVRMVPNDKDDVGQQLGLSENPAVQATPLLIGAAFLLEVLPYKGIQELLRDNVLQCAEPLTEGSRVALNIVDGGTGGIQFLPIYSPKCCLHPNPNKRLLACERLK